MSDVTQILSRMDSGDPAASAELLPLVYNELRKLAAARLAQEKPGQTLQATALVHEAYLRLVDVDALAKADGWNSRGHFFGAAAEAMRRILVEIARRKGRQKHGGDLHRLDNDGLELPADDSDADLDVKLLAMDEALSKLAAMHPDKAEVVKLRYFAGLTLEEAASALGVSSATVERHWRYARAWLARELG